MFRKKGKKEKQVKKWQLDLEESDNDDDLEQSETKGGAIVCVECEGIPQLRCMDCNSYYCLKCYKEGHQSTDLATHTFR